MTLLRTFLATAALAVAASATPAGAGSGAAALAEEGGRAAAKSACTAINAYAPVAKAEAVPDGMGDWLVWLEDRDGDLWICNAGADGAVYANSLITGDLLEGRGGALLEMGSAVDAALDEEPPQTAERLCVTVGRIVDDLELVATIEDGIGDYLVWMKNKDDALWMCNASADQKVYAFEKVGAPLNASEPPAGGLDVVTERRGLGI